MFTPPGQTPPIKKPLTDADPVVKTPAPASGGATPPIFSPPQQMPGEVGGPGAAGMGSPPQPVGGGPTRAPAPLTTPPMMSPPVFAPPGGEIPKTPKPAHVQPRPAGPVPGPAPMPAQTSSMTRPGGLGGPRAGAGPGAGPVGGGIVGGGRPQHGGGGHGGGGGHATGDTPAAHAAGAPGTPGAPGAGAPPVPVQTSQGGQTTTNQVAGDPTINKFLDQYDQRMGSDQTQRATAQASTNIANQAAGRMLGLNEQMAARGVAGSGVGNDLGQRVGDASQRLQAGAAAQIQMNEQARKDNLFMGSQGLATAPGHMAQGWMGLGLQQQGQQMGQQNQLWNQQNQVGQQGFQQQLAAQQMAMQQQQMQQQAQQQVWAQQQAQQQQQWMMMQQMGQMPGGFAAAMPPGGLPSIGGAPGPGSYPGMGQPGGNSVSSAPPLFRPPAPTPTPTLVSHAGHG